MKKQALRLFGAISVLILMTVGIPKLSSAASGDSRKNCLDTASSLSQNETRDQAQNTSGSKSIYLSLETQEAFKKAILRFREIETRNRSEDVGKEFRLGFSKYKVLYVLGGGRDGRVYAVKAHDGLKTLKVFYDRNDLIRGLWGLRQLRKQGYKTVRVQAFDYWNKTVLMDYIEGLPTSLLVCPYTYEQRRLHLDEIPYYELQNHFKRMQKSKFRGALRNSILEFSSGQPVIIDYE